MSSLDWYNSAKKYWDFVEPYLKRPDLYLLLVSVFLLYLVVLFQSRYFYWPITIIVLCVISLVTFVFAITYSWVRPFAEAWKGYGFAAILSLALLIWLGAAAFFYLYPLLLFLALLLAALKGGSNAASKH